ncbi:hypothetical protein ACP70R_034390 [Stipagrostis hirtigluma subsp. patula]
MGRTQRNPQATRPEIGRPAQFPRGPSNHHAIFGLVERQSPPAPVSLWVPLCKGERKKIGHPRSPGESGQRRERDGEKPQPPPPPKSSLAGGAPELAPIDLLPPP